MTVSNGAFRGTISAVCSRFLHEHTANAGGSLNLLYHEKYGVVCAATSASYSPTEPLNQQYLRNANDSPCMTAQFIVDGKMGCQDTDVTLTVNGTEITAIAPTWQAKYMFNENSVDIELKCENGFYNLPIVCKKNGNVTVSEDKSVININQML